MPPKKAARSEKSTTAADAAAHKEHLAASLEDPLLAKDAPIKVSEVFDQLLQRKTFLSGAAQVSFNWSAFRDALNARDEASPRWFVQLREEDLLLEPDGLTGATVECFVIAEAPVPTLSPAHYIVREHLPHSDIEDNAPERVLKIAAQNMHWRALAKEDGTLVNAYILQKVGQRTLSFGFGSAAPATTTTTAAAIPATFGFGTAAPTMPSAPVSFGFGFGNAAAAPAGASTPASAPETKAAAQVKQLKASEVHFVLWSSARAKEMLKEKKSGSRVVIEGFTAPGLSEPLKLVMQNDSKDDVKKVAHEILTKQFAKANKTMVAVDKWMSDCPVFDEAFYHAVQHGRAKLLEKTIKDCKSDFQELVSKYQEPIAKRLSDAKTERRAIVDSEVEELEHVLELMKKGQIAEKSSFRTLKFYAMNDVLRFRPFGKISGISESGESAECVPPAYKFRNAFLEQQRASS